MKISPRLAGFLWFLFVILLVCLAIAACFFLTAWLYQLAGLTVPAVLAQIINTLLGLILLGVTIRLIISIFKDNRLAGELKLYQPIIDALNRIAKGDFTVSVGKINSRNAHELGILGELVKSVDQMARELGELDTMRQEFISNVSHEIQSPLTSIRGFARALHNDSLRMEERRHYLTIIETESTRLSSLSDNLLKLAYLDSTQVKIETSPYRLDRQIRDLVLACEPQWLGKSLEIELALDEVTISADRELLGQVWTNLIHNSIKFTPPGGKLCLGLSRNGEEIEFKIRDNGIGISLEDQARIFERFYKADKSRTGSSGGSGLGLAISSRIVELHRGRIKVESQPGEGAVFSVLLPAG